MSNAMPQKSEQKRRKTIAFDFDGVIHGYSKGWQGGECYDPPVPGSIEFLKESMRTHNVLILTTRDVEVVADYLWKQDPEMELHIEAFYDSVFWNEEGVILVTNRKVAAEFYIDDRALRFRGDWREMSDSLQNERPWNEKSE